MINYGLPTSIYIDGKEYIINKNGDFRMVLDVISALNDDNLTEQEKAYTALNIFYNFNVPKDAQKAVDEMMVFINCGNTESKKEESSQPLMSWEKDFPLIIAPLNKALGYETRTPDRYTHWWTFVGGYMEIDNKCTFSTVISIRQKRKKGKKLDGAERQFYEENRDIIDLPIKYTQEEKDFFDSFLENA